MGFDSILAKAFLMRQVLQQIAAYRIKEIVHHTQPPAEVLHSAINPLPPLIAAVPAQDVCSNMCRRVGCVPYMRLDMAALRSSPRRA